MVSYTYMYDLHFFSRMELVRICGIWMDHLTIIQIVNGKITQPEECTVHGSSFRMIYVVGLKYT